jgi:hypothetical protein
MLLNNNGTIPYSKKEISLVIELRKEGLVGQRLSERFRVVFPQRNHRSVINKVQNLRNKKVLR